MLFHTVYTDQHHSQTLSNMEQRQPIRIAYGPNPFPTNPNPYPPMSETLPTDMHPLHTNIPLEKRIAVIALRLLCGMTFAVIAEKLGVRHRAAHRIYSRAMERTEEGLRGSFIDVARNVQDAPRSGRPSLPLVEKVHEDGTVTMEKRKRDYSKSKPRERGRKKDKEKTLAKKKQREELSWMEPVTKESAKRMTMAPPSNGSNFNHLDNHHQRQAPAPPPGPWICNPNPALNSGIRFLPHPHQPSSIQSIPPPPPPSSTPQPVQQPSQNGPQPTVLTKLLPSSSNIPQPTPQPDQTAPQSTALPTLLPSSSKSTQGQTSENLPVTAASATAMTGN